MVRSDEMQSYQLFAGLFLFSRNSSQTVVILDRNDYAYSSIQTAADPAPAQIRDTPSESFESLLRVWSVRH